MSLLRNYTVLAVGDCRIRETRAPNLIVRSVTAQLMNGNLVDFSLSLLGMSR